MGHDGYQKRIYADGALQKFIDARASGTVSADEMEKLKSAAQEEAARMADIDSDQSFANGRTLKQLLSEIEQPR